MLSGSREYLLRAWLCVQAVPKPCPDAQAREQGARKVWLSDVFATSKSPPLAKRGLQKKDWEYAVFMAVIHGLCLLAPFTFSWQMVGIFFVSYFITGTHCRLAAHPRHQSVMDRVWNYWVQEMRIIVDAALFPFVSHP